MRRALTATMLIGLLLLTTGVANAYTASFTGTLDDTLFEIWKPPHDQSAPLNYTYYDYTFLADTSTDHTIQVEDDDPDFDFTPVLYLYDTSFNDLSVTSNLVNTPSQYATQSLIATLTAGKTYHLVITTETPFAGVWEGDFKATVNPVPIPPSAWLLVSGIIGLIGVKRRF